MKAMILAAGRGSRMGKITNKIPKPLIKVDNLTLIEHNIIRVRELGIKEIVINVAWLGQLIINKVGDGSKYGAKITYSNEGQEPIGTANGIRKVIDYFEDKNFWLCNADIFSDFKIYKKSLRCELYGHLILVNNPNHHLSGDFSLCGENVIPKQINNSLTFSGISFLSPKMFVNDNSSDLESILFKASKENLLTGEFYNGKWIDIGTQKRLKYAKGIIKKTV